MKEKLIIFDMDNTVLSSRIDFPLMDAETRRILAEFGVAADPQLATSPQMNKLEAEGRISPACRTAVWQRVAEIEQQGMRLAEAEPGIDALLSQLQQQAHLVLITTTCEAFALESMRRLQLESYFEHIWGRESLSELKPAPGGLLQALAEYPQLTAADALMVGDGDTDFQAARAAKMKFVAYTGSRDINWPQGSADLLLAAWDESAADQILELFA
ncbi:MAG: HAD hydrolase-like protein [Firmicutes bacterium]|nr:HAD hydrolase-like protein [Bacillota bacterium]